MEPQALPPTPPTLAERLVDGDRRALARAISLVEDGRPEGAEVLDAVYGRTGRAVRIGITGPPGVGKSTLISALTTAARARDQRVAVLAVDPSSVTHSGALLGDRLRLSEHFLDPGVFIRSMASRGALGGLARATMQAAALVDAAGYDVVYLETLGVGQAEVDIGHRADTVVLVLMPGAGDAIQALKSGIMEIPDVIVVNRARTPGSESTMRHVREALSLRDATDWTPPVVPTDTTDGTGLAELGQVLDDHQAFLAVDGRLLERRRRNAAQEVASLVEAQVAARVQRVVSHDAAARDVIERVARRQLGPLAAAQQILDGHW